MIYTKQTWKRMNFFNCDYTLNEIIRLFFKEEGIFMYKKVALKNRKKNNFNKFTLIIIM